MAAAVLDQIDLNGKIVTAGAWHTLKATARHIHEHGGQFVLPVKENRRALFAALDALPWTANTITDNTVPTRNRIPRALRGSVTLSSTSTTLRTPTTPGSSGPPD